MDLRRAATISVPPSRYLGFPWPDWCETDCLLDRAVAEHDRRLCSCGCGFWASETQSEDADEFDGEFTVERSICAARAALDGETQSEQKKKRPTKGLLMWVRRKTVDDD